MSVLRKPSFKLIRMPGKGSWSVEEVTVNMFVRVKKELMSLGSPSTGGRCVLADGDRAAGPELSLQPAHEEVGG